MLTVRFIGFFSIFRKGNIMAGVALLSVIFMAPLAFYLPERAGAAQSSDEEESAVIYHGRDMEGNRIFGTDHRATPPFHTDPETGDRYFHTPPPGPSTSSRGDEPEYIFVAPEVHPENNWQGGQLPPEGHAGGKPSNEPGNTSGGGSALNKPIRQSLSLPPGGYPPAYDHPPRGGASFIPRSPVWEGSDQR